MINRVFEKTTIPLMERLLNVTSVRQRLIASNIANAYTPGYANKDVDFEQSLASAQQKQGIEGLRTQEGHMPLGTSHSGSTADIAVVSEGTPDMETEMGKVAENQMLYTTAAQIMSGTFKSLLTSVRGRV